MRPVSKLFTLALLILSLSAFGTSHQKMLDRVQGSIVRITGKTTVESFFGTYEADYVCSGFVIDKYRVMTAAHCVHDMMLVDGVAGASVHKQDAYYDLAVLDVETHKPALSFNDKPLQRGDAVTAMGYGYGFTSITALEVKVMLVDFSPLPNMPPGYWTQGQFIGGMSGGPVVDGDGRVVAIVQQATNEGTGYGVGTLLMRAFLLGT